MPVAADKEQSTTYRMSDVRDEKNDVRHFQHSPQLSPRLKVQLEVADLTSLVLLKNFIQVVLDAGVSYCK